MKWNEMVCDEMKWKSKRVERVENTWKKGKRKEKKREQKRREGKRR